MLKGIKVITEHNSSINILERLSISSGTIERKGTDYYNLRKYKPSSFIPKNDWRELTKSEQKKIIGFSNSDNESAHKNSIGLITIPKLLKKEFLDIGFGKCKNADDYNNIYATKMDKVKALPKKMGHFLATLITKGYGFKDIELFCISFEKPSIETVAYDVQDNEYFGLHIDDGLKNSIFSRTTNPNRLSINLGIEPRYLFFVNLSARQIFNLVSRHEPLLKTHPKAISTRELVVKFFTHYPDYPVFRLKQMPFEAYFALTDNIIHDGSTLDKEYPDITIVFIGHFSLPTQS